MLGPVPFAQCSNASIFFFRTWNWIWNLAGKTTVWFSERGSHWVVQAGLQLVILLLLLSQYHLKNKRFLFLNLVPFWGSHWRGQGWRTKHKSLPDRLVDLHRFPDKWNEPHLRPRSSEEIVCVSHQPQPTTCSSVPDNPKWETLCPQIKRTMGQEQCTVQEEPRWQRGSASNIFKASTIPLTPTAPGIAQGLWHHPALWVLEELRSFVSTRPWHLAHPCQTLHPLKGWKV